jgi:hypothetical protein
MTEPTDDVLDKLRAGKRELRRKRIAMSLPEKVRQVVELQKIVLPAIRRRRALRAWERVGPVKKGEASRAKRRPPLPRRKAATLSPHSKTLSRGSPYNPPPACSPTEPSSKTFFPH